MRPKLHNILAHLSALREFRLPDNAYPYIANLERWMKTYWKDDPAPTSNLQYGFDQEPSIQTFIPYQCCPKCTGQGTVCKPPWVAGDVHQWSSSAGQYPCDVCHGAKIIPMCPDIKLQNEAIKQGRI